MGNPQNTTAPQVCIHGPSAVVDISHLAGGAIGSELSGLRQVRFSERDRETLATAALLAADFVRDDDEEEARDYESLWACLDSLRGPVVLLGTRTS